MKLKNGTIRPGVVIEVLEDNKIKADVPGLFSRLDQENLPIIMPWPCGINKNSYSQIKEYDKVWVVNFSDNPLQLYWFRKDNVEDNKEIIQEENVEIVCNRETDLGWATIYFSDGSGWIIRNANSVIQLKADGSILLDSGSPKRLIDINASSISLGAAGKASHPAVYGDKLMEVLMKIQTALDLIKQASNMSPYTKPIAMVLRSLPGQIDELIPEVVSTNVTLE